MGETRKLAELRAKTDRQVCELISRRLDEGVSEAADGWIGKAEGAYAEAQRLLPMVRDAERAASLQAKLGRLRVLLNEMPLGCARAACF